MKTNRAIWIPYADVMAALVLLFALLIIFFALKDEEEKIPSVDNNKTDILVPVSILVLDLYKELNASVENKYDKWGIRLLDDLTITFENPVVLFEQDSYLIKQEFEDILDQWAPVYFSIVTKDKYRNVVKEIKIEGHTARKSPVHNSYIRTVELSQHRARSILDYIMQTSYFKSLPLSGQKRLEYMVSANGFGYGRAIDDEYIPVIVSGNPISHKSRRVLFKIIIHSAGEDIVAHIKGI
ncbi:MAG: OmpA family protein [Candidatus Portiera sp.]|nr:OmpA family protein [Portiera sp.]